LKSELLKKNVHNIRPFKNEYFFFKLTKIKAADIRLSAEFLRNAIQIWELHFPMNVLILAVIQKPFPNNLIVPNVRFLLSKYCH